MMDKYKISDAIKELQELLEEQGDLDIYTFDDICPNVCDDVMNYIDMEVYEFNGKNYLMIK